MKTNKLRLLLALAGLLVTENPLGAAPGNLRENGPSASFTPNYANGLKQNEQAQDAFFTEGRGTLEVQKKAAAAATIKNLQNEVASANAKISTLKKQLKATTADVKQVQKEHARLKAEKTE